MYKIDKNIEMPTALLYPFKDMEVGDSFFIEAKDKKEAQSFRLKAMGAARQYVYKSQSKDLKYVTRYVENGIRIWRIK